MTKDPVCGMDVDETVASHFCAPGCKKVFEAEPEKYLDPKYTAHM